MPNIQLEIRDGLVYLKAAQHSVAKQIERIDTETKNYIVDPRLIGDAIRTQTPMLQVQSYGSQEVRGISAVTFGGRVFGHPKHEDKSAMTTSNITAFHLEGGEVFQTTLGLKNAVTGQDRKLGTDWKP